MKQQIEPTPENISRVFYIIRQNEKLERATRGEYVVKTAEEEQELIQSGVDYEQLMEHYDIAPILKHVKRA